MVLESLITVEAMKRKPFLMLLVTFVVTTASVFISHSAFPNEPMVASLLIAVAFAPLFHSMFVKTEMNEEQCEGSMTGFFGRNIDVIMIYAFLFVGLIISYSLLYAFLPVSMMESVFEKQNSTIGLIEDLRIKITGQFSGNVMCTPNDFGCIFQFIFYNNMGVMIWAWILSFLYGAGAIFLISWNASVLGAFIGKELLIAKQAFLSGSPAFGDKLLGALVKPLGWLPHGIPEAIGYFLGAIGGAIISVAISRRTHGQGHTAYKTIAKDFLALVFVSVASIAIGAMIETSLFVGDQGSALTLSLVYLILFTLLVVSARKRIH